MHQLHTAEHGWGWRTRPSTGVWRMKQIYLYAYSPLCAFILLLGIMGKLPRVGPSTKGEGSERRYFYGSVWAVTAAQTVLLLLWKILPETRSRNRGQVSCIYRRAGGGGLGGVAGDAAAHAADCAGRTDGGGRVDREALRVLCGPLLSPPVLSPSYEIIPLLAHNDLKTNRAKSDRILGGGTICTPKRFSAPTLLEVTNVAEACRKPDFIAKPPLFVAESSSFASMPKSRRSAAAASDSNHI